MPESSLLPLTEWENYYVIVGSSAAALTGLQFVVIALGADARRLSGPDALEAFATPTVVHFCAVLLLAAISSTPRQSPGTFALCILLSGLAGLVYVCAVLRQARRQKDYKPVLEDWIWHQILPMIGYTALFIGAAGMSHDQSWALFLIGAAALLLLCIGIHNAWDTVAYVVARDAEQKQ